MAGKIAGAVLAAVAVAAVVAALTGGGERGSKPDSTLAEVTPNLSEADPRLKKIVAQANRLLPGGRRAFDQRIAELRGIPVVVNKWGSWCDPCRREFPLFQRAAKERGAKIAFLGVNVADSEGDARSFLREQPVPYPSYVDAKLAIAKLLKPVQGAPTTGFFDAKGGLTYVHIGEYKSQSQLDADIDRYARRD